MASGSLPPQAGLSNPAPTVFSPSQKPRHSVEHQDAVVMEIFDLIRDIKDPEHPHTLEELNVVNEDSVTVHHHRNHSLCCTGGAISDRGSDKRPPESKTSEATSGETNEPGRHSANTNGDKEEEEEEEEKELWIKIVFTPTVPHCSLATLIGLCLRVKLERRLEADNFKLDIVVSEGAHAIEEDVNKQINDKERVAAAMENPGLREMVEECIRDPEY